MANEGNLKPQNKRTKREQREIAQKGGIESGKARREQATIQNMLNKFLDGEIKNNKTFAKLADKLGIEKNKSVKELFTTVCMLNTLKKGRIDDLEKLVKLIGEEADGADSNALNKLDEILEGMKNNAEN